MFEANQGFSDQVVSRVRQLPAQTDTYELVTKDGQHTKHKVVWTPTVDAEPIEQFHLVLENSKYLRIGSAVYSCEMVLSITKVEDKDYRARLDPIGLPINNG